MYKVDGTTRVFRYISSPIKGYSLLMLRKMSDKQAHSNNLSIKLNTPLKSNLILCLLILFKICDMK